MGRVLLLALGGAVGTVARYGTATLMGRWLGASFPYGTLAVNVLGSLILTAIMTVALGSTSISPTLRLALTTGFCGGFTTYSTFNYETTRLIEEGAIGVASLNVVLTLALCGIAGLAGGALGKVVLGVLKTAQPAA